MSNAGPIEPDDIDRILGSLSLEDKVALLAGADAWHTVAVPGVPALRCSDGPTGVRGTSWQGPPSASFPCATALAASFDPQLVEEVGRALGREARSKHAHVLLAPTVNLHRTPIGGRNFECFSEDPVLTARIAAGYIRGVQAEGVASCVKHFVANDTEFERMTISSEVDERTLRELYLVPFETAVAPVADGGAAARVVMSSYNRVNGTYASEHGPLLRGVLRDEWGFGGTVISDWYGTHSAAASLEAGLDLEMPGPARLRGEHLLEAVRAGEVGEQRVDESARRLLELIAWTRAGADDASEGTDDSPETQAVSHRAAVAGMVLLKNDDDLLPLAATAGLAVLGPNAERGQIQGGGSARVRANHPVPLLAELRARGLDIVYEQGCSIDKRLPDLRGAFSVQITGGSGQTATEHTERLRLMWMNAPADGIELAHFGAHVDGSFVPSDTGDWEVSLSSVGPAVLRVDGEVVVDLSEPQTGGAFFGLGSPEVRATVALEGGVATTIEVDYPIVADATLRGLVVGAASPPRSDGIARAAAAAAAAEVAVVVVGTNDDWETEGEDRTSLELPGEQNELIAAVAAANPRTVVVINAGSPVAMPWLDSVAAVMQVWFPGETLGDAIADVLLGDAEPGGRLPVTLPRRLVDTPAYTHHPGRDGQSVYGEALRIGYRWYDAQQIDPLFPFGHGLGYSTFDMEPSAPEGSVDGMVHVAVAVRNTSARPGSTVVQCYVEPPVGGPDRPVRTLQAFAKVSLPAGESTTVHLQLVTRAFSVWDVDAHDWVVPPGEYRILVGSSSRELVDAGTIEA